MNKGKIVVSIIGLGSIFYFLLIFLLIFTDRSFPRLQFSRMIILLPVILILFGFYVFYSFRQNCLFSQEIVGVESESLQYIDFEKSKEISLENNGNWNSIRYIFYIHIIQQISLIFLFLLTFNSSLLYPIFAIFFVGSSIIMGIFGLISLRNSSLKLYLVYSFFQIIIIPGIIAIYDELLEPVIYNENHILLGDNFVIQNMFFLTLIPFYLIMTKYIP